MSNAFLCIILLSSVILNAKTSFESGLSLFSSLKLFHMELFLKKLWKVQIYTEKSQKKKFWKEYILKQEKYWIGLLNQKNIIIIIWER